MGSPTGWPQSLRAIVSLMLGSKFPMFVAWGDALEFLYNDAYAEILGAKHPQALGRPFREIWGEIWSDIAPLIDAALSGVSTYRENLPLTMNRKGFAEQTWFTFSYSPVRDDDGRVSGMFCAVVETTDTVLAARRQAFLFEFEERIRDVVSADEVMAIASEMLGRTFGISRVGYGEVDQEQEHVLVDRDWTAPDVRSVAGRHHLNDFGPRMIADLKAGRVVLVEDATTDPRIGESREAFDALGVRAFAGVPLIKAGRFTALLFLHCPSARTWTREEEALAIEVAERTWARSNAPGPRRHGAPARRASAPSTKRWRSRSQRVRLSGTGSGTCRRICSPAPTTVA